MIGQILSRSAPVSGHEIVPGGGHVAARWRSTVLPGGGRLFCPRWSPFPCRVHRWGLLLLLDWSVTTTVTVEQEERV